MRHKFILKILVILGVVLFTGRLVSHLFLFLAESQSRVNRIRYLKASHMFFPLDYFSAYKNGFGWLERGYNEKNNKMLDKSILWFKKSITLNPFFHYSHHHLGKAYLFHSYPNSDYFDEGVAELKRAVKIYQHNKHMIRDISEVFLSMWPLLSEADKQLSRDLLMKYAHRFSWEEFKSIAELWWLYSKEIPFIKALLDKNPTFLSPMARILIQGEGPLNLRWTFLADFETHVLKEVIRKYRKGPLVAESLPEFEQSLLEQMRMIKRYDTLIRGKTFNQDRFQKYILLLIGNRIENLVNRFSDDMSQSIKDEIGRLILEYSAAEPDLKDLLKLENLLERKGFFKVNDLGSMVLKFRMQFSQANFSDMIDEIEKLKQSISFVKQQHMPEYIKILILLSDAYESSKLLTVADSTLRDILKIDADNPDIWIRLFRIQQVLGDDELEKQAVFRENIVLLKQSRFLTVTESYQTFAVFLMDSNEIQISVNPDLINHLQEKRIVQIFIDGFIRYEEYIDRLPDPIKLTVEETGEIEKVVVEVRFL